MHDIIKYRGELMGIATLLILIHHYYTTTGFFLIPVAPPLAYCGVDMFLFLSGFGLCLGYGKYKSVAKFYKRRISRIYPAYLTAIIIGALAVTSLSVVDILLQSTTLPAYVHIHDLNAFDWYVPAIVLFYLLFPMIYSLIRKGLRWGIAVVLCSFIPAVLKIAGFLEPFSPLMLGRLPIFVVGVAAGVLYLNRFSIRPYLRTVLEVIAIIGFLVMFIIINRTGSGFYKYMVIWFPFIVIVPGLCLLSCRLLDYAPKSVCVALSFIGGISLEVYLIHSIYVVQYGNYVTESGWWSSSPLLQWVAGLLLIVSALVSGYMLSLFVKFAANGYEILKKRLHYAMMKK